MKLARLRLPNFSYIKELFWAPKNDTPQMPGNFWDEHERIMSAFRKQEAARDHSESVKERVLRIRETDCGGGSRL